jgi:hypothetical protein
MVFMSHRQKQGKLRVESKWTALDLVDEQTRNDAVGIHPIQTDV